MEATQHPVLGKLPAEWVAEPLVDCCSYVQRGKAPAYVEESDIFALNQKAIRWGRIEEGHLKFHDPDVKIAERHFIKPGDVVVNSTGDITIGRAYLFHEVQRRIFADSHVTIVRTVSSKLRPEFLVNLLATNEYQDLVYSLVTGSTGQLELNKTNLEALPTARLKSWAKTTSKLSPRSLSLRFAKASLSTGLCAKAPAPKSK